MSGGREKAAALTFASINFGGIVQEPDGAMGLRKSGYDSRGSNFSGTRKTAIRAVRIGETPGAAPGCPTTFYFPPKRRKRRTPLVMGRGRCMPGWWIIFAP